jgi:MFS family permease
VVYSVFTALSAITWNWESFGLARFLTGVGIGAEWGVGTSLLQEVWPERWRTRGAGLLQAGFSVGGLLVSALWVLIGSSLGQSWRWMYLFGLIPLIIVLLVRKRIPESQRWASAAKRVRIRDLLKVPVRRNFLAALAVSIGITGGWWAVSSYLPSFVGSLVTSPTRTAFYTGWAGALYNFSEIIGCVLFGFAAEYWGRKVSAVVYFAGCLVIVPIVFLLVHDAAVATWLQLIAGFFTGGIYSWYTVHTPELFSTAHRATAISAVFSGSRYLAMIGAVLTGTLSAAVGGFGHAAALFTPFFLLGLIAVLFLPETRGKNLPE